MHRLYDGFRAEPYVADTTMWPSLPLRLYQKVAYYEKWMSNMPINCRIKNIKIHRLCQTERIKKGQFDVGDGCWRRIMFVVSLRCWWTIYRIEECTEIYNVMTQKCRWCFCILIFFPVFELSFRSTKFITCQNREWFHFLQNNSFSIFSNLPIND